MNIQNFLNNIFFNIKFLYIIKMNNSLNIVNEIKDINNIYNNENWMLNYQNKSIINLIIPGSHNSFALKFKSFSHNDLNLPKIFNPYIKLWAKTQNKTITEQLNMGIRYFDIRVEEYNNIYYTVHSLLSIELNNILNEILNFIINHPSEKIIIDINHLYNITNYNNLQEYLLNKFNEYLIDNNISNFTKPISEVQGNIYLFYTIDNNKIFPNNLINSIWYDTNNINNLCNNIINETLQPNKLNICQCILTPKTEDILNGIFFFFFFPISLKSLTEKNNDEMMITLNNISKNKNIIIKDFVDEDFINLCINSNNKN